MQDPVRIAAWSGPRNISTAMMRSWGARPGCFVTDEPLYANYLRVTGIDHPGREETMQADPRPCGEVCQWLAGDVPGGRPVWYQKHMAHHLIGPRTPGGARVDLGTGWEQRDEGGLAWMDALHHVMLVREPREMLASFARVIPNPNADDLGLPQQVELQDWLVRTTGAAAPVLVAADVLRDPAGVLRELCACLGVPWTDAMLNWEPGPRDTDGVWAPHWYANVEASTGFAPYVPKDVMIPEHLADVLAECQRLYDSLLEHRIGARG